MAMVQSERTRRMMENFMKLHLEGKSVKEIAEEFGLSPKTVYNNLQEIAEANECERDELLERVPKGENLLKGRMQEREARTTFNEVAVKLRETEQTIYKTIGLIDKMLEEIEEDRSYENA